MTTTFVTVFLPYVLPYLLFSLSGEISFQSNFKVDHPKMARFRGIVEIKRILQQMLQVSQNFATLVLLK